MNTAVFPNNKKVQESQSFFRLLVIISIDFFYDLFISKPISTVKSYSKHPLSIATAFLFMFPVYFLFHLILSIIKITVQFTAPQNGKTAIRRRYINEAQESEDDMQQWLERCSICFEAKLDLCLDSCKDQFCLECFEKYVSEVVKSSWGLKITKIRCPVCRIYVPQTEWTKFVPNSIVDLYNEFNRPYRSFSRCSPCCDTEVTPCKFDNTVQYESQSKCIAQLVKTFFSVVNMHVTAEHHLDHLSPSISYQQSIYRIFEKLEWRNSTLVEIHHQLMTKLLRTCSIVDQNDKAKIISQHILQLNMGADFWRKLQFDHISFFSSTNCPSCEKLFCLHCGYEGDHKQLTCEENMKRLLTQTEVKQTSEDLQTLKWKLENSRKCPSCCILINRDEGCNKVECTMCGYSFCWECRFAWLSGVGCGYFKCSSLKVSSSKKDEGGLLSSDGDGSIHIDSASQSTELGVPNVNMIHLRLNNT